MAQSSGGLKLRQERNMALLTELEFMPSSNQRNQRHITVMRRAGDCPPYPSMTDALQRGLEFL